MLIDLEDVCRTVGVVLGHRAPKPDDRLEEDLGAESFDVLNILVTLDEKHGISIPETAMADVSTVRDLYDVVVKSAHAASGPSDPARTA